MLLKNQLAYLSKPYTNYAKILRAYPGETDIDSYFYCSILTISTKERYNRKEFFFKVLKLVFSKLKKRYLLAEDFTLNKQFFSTVVRCCNSFLNQFEKAENWTIIAYQHLKLPLNFLFCKAISFVITSCR